MKSFYVRLALSVALLAQQANAQQARILEIENTVEVSKFGDGVWAAAAIDQDLAIRDRVRTRQRSRATVRLTDLYTMRMEKMTTIEISPVLVGGGRPQLDVFGGAALIFSREADGEMDIKTPSVNAALRGTQFYVRVSEGGASLFQVLEGALELANPQGKLLLNAGEAGEALPGQAPRRTAVIEARNLLQWALHYPAVLDPADLRLPEPEMKQLSASLEAYRNGDLMEALRVLPERAPSSIDGRVFYAGVLLAVGRLDECRPILDRVPMDHPGRRALERMVEAVLFREQVEWDITKLATSSEAVAESYYRQSRSKLEEARAAARRATERAPANGFAWTRLAELEFSFGRTAAARAALVRGLELTPRNAHAHALNGFVLSAQNRIGQARQSFETAVRLDGSLGNGWLGLGLTKIKQGQLEAGRADLQAATTVQPTISMFHSYLGKAFSTEDKAVEARKDLNMARKLDPNDPTPLLYSAMEYQKEYRFNQAIEELEESIRLNDNRRVFRSSLLLDQDRAVRGANLARIYQNAGMRELAVREATRAVENDYTNASAHLFLANSFDALRDPKRILLRYETPWFNELLLSNLLSPVGSGPLSQFVSQQEYSKMFEANGIGGSLVSEWMQDNETQDVSLRTDASIYGTWKNLSIGVDASIYDDDGDRINSAARREEIYGQVKWQATENDILYFLGKWQDQKNGDLFETYDNQPLSPGLEFIEKQEPGLLLGGWNHRWAPGVHTLVLGGKLGAEQWLTDPGSRQMLVTRDTLAFRPGLLQTDEFGLEQFTDPALNDPLLPPASVDLVDGQSVIYSPALQAALAPYIGSGAITGVTTAPFAFSTHREFEIYTLELQQIWQTSWNTLLIGGRHQEGDIETEATLSVVRPNFNGGFTTPASSQRTEVGFERDSFYAYDYLKPFSWLTLIGGVSWDRIEHPDNFRNPPVNDLQREEERVSGKAGFTISPNQWFAMRGVYTESLGGVTFDESVRLEPVQVAGFNQAYRTLLSESLAGSVETPLYRNWGLGVEGKLPTRTWWGATGTIVDQDVDRTVGNFSGYDLVQLPISPAFFPDGIEQQLDYREESFSATINQLLWDEFSLGAGYRVTRSTLHTDFPEIPVEILPQAELEDEATLHELSLSANWNSPTGLFARFEANWFGQDLADDPLNTPVGMSPREGDEFWQYNVFLGYRSLRNRVEVSAGLLNLAGTGYQLSPLNPVTDLVRNQTVVVRCRVTF